MRAYHDIRVPRRHFTNAHFVEIQSRLVIAQQLQNLASTKITLIQSDFEHLWGRMYSSVPRNCPSLAESSACHRSEQLEGRQALYRSQLGCQEQQQEPLNPGRLPKKVTLAEIWKVIGWLLPW